VKSRIGFVSNSSTTSFCIYGAAFESEPTLTIQALRDFRSQYPADFAENIRGLGSSKSPWASKVLKMLTQIDDASACSPAKVRNCEHSYDTQSPFCPHCGKPTWKEVASSVQETLDSLSDDWYDAAKYFKLESHSGQEGCGFYLGRSYTSMDQEQTRKQFEEDIRNRLTCLFWDKIDKMKFGIHEEAYYNG